MSEPFGSPKASWKASRMVRKGGFEPPRYCYRQPLKLVRLPVPPLPQKTNSQPIGSPEGLRYRARAMQA